MQRLVRAMLCACVAGMAGCYDGYFPQCAFQCGDQDACPRGYGCGANNICALELPGGGLAVCTVDAAVDAGIDAAEDAAVDATADAAVDGAPDGDIDASPPPDAMVDATPNPPDAIPPDAMMMSDAPIVADSG